MFSPIILAFLLIMNNFAIGIPLGFIGIPKDQELGNQNSH